PNVMALLRLSERSHGDSEAINDGSASVTYRKLLAECIRLSAELKRRYSLTAGTKVGLAGRNRLSLVRAIFAVSATGADLYLLHPELSRSQLAAMAEDAGLALLLFDGEELEPLSDLVSCQTLSLADATEWTTNMEPPWDEPAPTKAASGRIMLLTGGTTGRSKRVPHQPSLLRYLPPFHALLTKLPYLTSRTVYIATPIAHGYGIANLFLFIALGYKICLSPRFDAAGACRLVDEHRVEVATVVPVMLRKMLRHDQSALRSLRCIASGGAELSPKLAEETMNLLGDVVYNLYGTTEGGLTTIATPLELKTSAGTIGRVIAGVPLQVLDRSGAKARDGSAGRMCIRAGRSLPMSRGAWIDTGDIGIREPTGLYRLCGRSDDMIVSGGENVYPADVEQAIAEHPLIEEAAVIGATDELFGQRLIGFVQPVRDAALTASECLEWLRPRVARYQMPREIVVMDELPYTPAGKLDKKRLRAIGK
ncbi:MAG: AMP-dependent synthetase and ligase, partial [Paenibacillus sp.]|nr:AMP-dependent synthetase and ligase [Paenibacillus sp.]